MDRFFIEFEIDESCRPKEWPRIPENGIPYSTDLVGWLSPIVVYGEIYQNPLTKLSAIRVKERRTFDEAKIRLRSTTGDLIYYLFS